MKNISDIEPLKNRFDYSINPKKVLRIPYEPVLWGRIINVHLVVEYLAFFIAFRYYIHLRQASTDPISTSNRLSIILGAAIGAFFGSRLMGFLENPLIEFTTATFIQLLNVKTIMGGLFGGLLGVEIMKWRLKEKQWVYDKMQILVNLV